MKKFIVALDGLKLSDTAVKYAVHLSKQCNAHLVGIFLEDFTRHSYGVQEIVQYEGTDFDNHIETLNAEDSIMRNESIATFEQACQHGGLNYSVHRDKNVAIQDLLHESIYADLLIISSDETLTRYEEPVPSRFIRELLGDVQCPVMLVQGNYKAIHKGIFLYDGSPSSVYALKMFSYLFEWAREINVEIVTVKAREESLHLPNHKLVKEFIKRHFPNAHYTVLKGLVEDELIKHIQKEKSNSIVVMGAYRRGRVSRFFKPSMADYLIPISGNPIFIAHYKS